MIKRADYIKDSSNLHRSYFGQFVNEEVKDAVLQAISKEALMASKDEHLNDIPIDKWDALSGFRFSKTTGEMLTRPINIDPIDIKLLKETGEGVSCATLVCIYKEAGKQIKGI